MAATTIRRLQGRLDGLALEQLRQAASEQAARIEALEQQLADMAERRDFWRQRADDLLQAIHDADFAEARGAASAPYAGTRPQV